MTERFYQLAGLRYRVLMPTQWVGDLDGVLSGFCAAAGDWDLEATLEVVEALSEPEGVLCFQDDSNWVFRMEDAVLRYKGAVRESLDGAYIRILRKGSRSTVQIKSSHVPFGITSKVIISCLESVHHLSAAGGFLLHAAWIAVNGKAILFTGPSGVGKSTQAALWEQYRKAQLINGDRAAVFPVEGGAQVRGIPYCGSSGVTKNVTMPLGAVVCLEQAPKTAITRLTGIRAFSRLWKECCVNIWNSDDIEKGSQSVSDVVSRVPIFQLACTPDLSAVLALEQEGVV